MEYKHLTLNDEINFWRRNSLKSNRKHSKQNFDFPANLIQWKNFFNKKRRKIWKEKYFPIPWLVCFLPSLGSSVLVYFPCVWDERQKRNDENSLSNIFSFFSFFIFSSLSQQWVIILNILCLSQSLLFLRNHWHDFYFHTFFFCLPLGDVCQRSLAKVMRSVDPKIFALVMRSWLRLKELSQLDST